ncbi:MAG: Nif3-like dinuclear metal center hexameric protein [bacterium]|nr:Nif3-like dinuclear metal center hexameric protein [bacterium]
MISRHRLNEFLGSVYKYENFDDYCENGIQVEGKEKIEKIVFGVSFNIPFLERAVAEKADALIVHHGIFGKGLFKLKGHLKEKIKMLLEYDVSLFGIHLPMDAHPEMGHSALLLKAVGARDISPFDLGVTGNNRDGHSLDALLDIFHKELHPENYECTAVGNVSTSFSLSHKHGFSLLRNGPDVPGKIAVITGGASYAYEAAVEAGVDTFCCGEIKERILALSLETATNYINLGHYFSEKPGILALKALIDDTFEVETDYIEIPNPV